MSMIQEANCIRRFKRVCGDGWDQGWHERNGGNLTYRMTEEDVKVCMPYFTIKGHEWVDMGVKAPELAGAFFVTTGSGKYMRKVALDTSDCIGIVEINETGDAWRIVWGLTNGGRPTSEFPTHFMNHSVRMKATDGANRVIYHAHTPNIITLSTLIEPDARRYSRILWKSMTECIIIFPEGVGVVPWMVPGGAEIAQATSELMQTYEAVVWTQHGLFCSGSDFDETFGLMHTIEKSAGLYLSARAAQGGSEPAYLIADDELRQVCTAFGVSPNDAFLD
ncbi:MAG: rhamnulose-1-phosphate aldolase [Eggerthellaceae bacterium]|nr:rhamnulose-1-phosphate aldolase [Eggerthellaceae bacterium]